MQEDPIFAALRELQTLSRIPLPMFRTPPWEKIRAALPPGATLPDRPVHVLADLDIDASGTVVHAAVGQVPPLVSVHDIVAACVGTDGSMTIQPPLDTASTELAQAVAAAHLGAKFSPGERDGQAVPVRMFRMGIEVSPAAVRNSAALQQAFAAVGACRLGPRAIVFSRHARASAGLAGESHEVMRQVTFDDSCGRLRMSEPESGAPK